MIDGQLGPQMWLSEFRNRVPPGGLEPPTVGLKVRCSAIELEGRAQKFSKMERQHLSVRTAPMGWLFRLVLREAAAGSAREPGRQLSARVTSLPALQS